MWQLAGCGGREDRDREQKEIKVLLGNGGGLRVVEKSWKTDAGVLVAMTGGVCGGRHLSNHHSESLLLQCPHPLGPERFS